MDAEERSIRSRDHPGRRPQSLPSAQIMRPNPSDLLRPAGFDRRAGRYPGLVRTMPGGGFVRHSSPPAWIGPVARVTPLLRGVSSLGSVRRIQPTSEIGFARRKDPSPHGRWVRSAGPSRIGRVPGADSPDPTGGWVRSCGVRVIGFARRNRPHSPRVILGDPSLRCHRTIDGWLRSVSPARWVRSAGLSALPI
jgi:hypothetical protein